MSPSRETVSRILGTGLTALLPRSTWSFGVTLGGSWYDNVYFTPTGAADSWGSGAQATLGYGRRFRTGNFSISGYGGMLYYPEAEGLDQGTYGGSMGLGWAPSPRTQISLSESYGRSNTRELRGPEGVPLPTSGVNSFSSTLGLSQQLSRRWQLSLGGAFLLMRYDASGLAGGEQLEATATLGRAVGRSASVYLGYGYTTTWLEEVQGGRTHVAQLGTQWQPKRGVSLDAGAGLAYLESTGQFYFYPAGHMNLSAQGRRTSISLAYERDFGQTFGYGRTTVADIVSAGVGWTPARRVSFSASYSFGEEKLGVGLETVRKSLQENKKLLNQIKKEVLRVAKG